VVERTTFNRSVIGSIPLTCTQYRRTLTPIVACRRDAALIGRIIVDLEPELTEEEINIFAEFDEDMREYAEQSARDYEKSNRIISKLKRKLKQKIWQPIEWELKSHYCMALGIVKKAEVKGRKESGYDYFCQSTAIRHVYNNVSSCSYSDSYGGNIYIRLSQDRYLMMFIHG
jgi:hypothetical protein